VAGGRREEAGRGVAGKRKGVGEGGSPRCGSWGGRGRGAVGTRGVEGGVVGRGRNRGGWGGGGGEVRALCPMRSVYWGNESWREGK